jgi:hypothetical protein
VLLAYLTMGAYQGGPIVQEFTGKDACINALNAIERKLGEVGNLDLDYSSRSSRSWATCVPKEGLK